MIEFGKLIDILPHSPVRSMEYVCTIFMNIDALNIFGVNIAANVFAPVDDKTLSPPGRRFVSKNRAIKARAYNKILIIAFAQNIPFPSAGRPRFS